MKNLKERIQELREILGSRTARSKFTFAKEVLEFIEAQSESEQPDFYRFVVENSPRGLDSGYELKDNEQHDEEFKLWFFIMTDKVKKFQKEIRNRNGEVVEVAQMLKERLAKIEKEDGKDAKISFFALLLFDRSIFPYFKLEYIVPTQEEMNEFRQDEELDRKLTAIMNAVEGFRFSNSGESATAVIQILDQEKDYRKKVFLIHGLVRSVFKDSHLDLFKKGLFSMLAKAAESEPKDLFPDDPDDLLGPPGDGKKHKCETCAMVEDCPLPFAVEFREKRDLTI